MQSFGHRVEHYVGEVNVVFTAAPFRSFFRYYDYKRSAEKKEHKTIEAADKVRKLLYSARRF